MIRIGSEIIKKQSNFWNNCIFHPTDAVEDSWGRRILDRMGEDGSIDTVRIYTMFEDIVYLDGKGELAFDFRITDLRLDYLVEKGFDVLLAYAFLPDFLTTHPNSKSCVSKNKTRYKGKLINTSMPKDIVVWEEICYQYTKHIVARYGIERVSRWHLHCWNEPDISAFFLGHLPSDMPESEQTRIRAAEYCRLYEGFERALLRVDERLRFGGPALARHPDFLDLFLRHVREHRLRLDYIALHNYSDKGPDALNRGGHFSVEDWIDVQKNTYQRVIDANGFSDTEIVVDEWGMATAGFYNIEECPKFIARETEVYPAYYVKLIHGIIKNGIKLEKLMICLSGQHEMVTDFSGFRNFFTLNFIAKPIYSAFCLGARLHEGLTAYTSDSDNLFAVPTRSEDGRYAILMCCCDGEFSDTLETSVQKLLFDEAPVGKTARIWCIDRENNNPYRLYERMGKPEMTDDLVELLKREGDVKVQKEFLISGDIELELSANSTYLVEIE